MTKEKAIEAMDRLTAAGYIVALTAVPKTDRWHDPNADEDGRNFRVQIRELGVDKVDLKALVKIADELDLEVGLHAVAGEGIVFSDPVDPVLGRQRDIVDGPRRHPR